MIRKFILLGMLMTFLSAATYASADEVFVTPNGKKYHQETCRLIKNKSSLTKIDKDEAVEEGYAPCKKCFPEDLVSGTNDTQKQTKEKNKKQKSG